MKPNDRKINSEVGEKSPQKIYAGIDISKEYLDVNVLRRHHRFTNDRKGHRSMFTLFSKQREVVHVVYESTGYLSRKLIPIFMEQGIAQTCLNPVIVRNYARSERCRAKTDRLDAEILARIGEDKQLKEDYPLSREILELKEYETVLAFYIKRRTQLKNELKATNQPFLKRQLEQSLKKEEKHIEEIQEKMEEIINSRQELKFKYEQYLEVSGIGKRNAMALISLMPELGNINRREASSLLGVVPYTWESGSMKGKSKIEGGRKVMRNLLYIATVSALRSNEVLREKYENLVTQGKARKCALIACCHTLIIHLNSLAKKLNLPSAASHAAEGIGGEEPPNKQVLNYS